MNLRSLHLIPKIMFFEYFVIFCVLYVCLQRRGGCAVCRDALGERGDHHFEGVGKHMEAALRGKKTT